MKLMEMVGVLFLPSLFVAGMATGILCGVPGWMSEGGVSTVLLGLLVFQVGMGLGSRGDFSDIVRTVSFRTLLLPGFTVAGTVAASAMGCVLLSGADMADCMAVGSGFGYYSLSSMLILQFKTPVEGVEAATLLASTALLANIIRELAALMLCAYVSRSGRGVMAISLAGVSSMDVCLPSILSDQSRKNLMPMAIIHGVALEVSVPLLLMIFC